MLKDYASRLRENPHDDVLVPGTDLEPDIQRVFRYLESLPSDVMEEVCRRLLLGVAAQARALVRPMLSAAKSTGAEPVLLPTPSSERRTALPNDTATAILDSRLGTLHDASDPIEAMETLGGLESLARILPFEPLGVLKAMARHPRMPGGPVKTTSRSAKGIAEAIVKHLHLQVPSQPTGAEAPSEMNS